MTHNTLVHQIVRPAVRGLATHTKVAPDHLTALRLATGLGAAASFAQGSTGWTALGKCLFLLSALLDRADGELARQTRRFSRHGHRWDLVADCACTAAVFIGLGFGVTGGPLGGAGVALGALAGIGVVSLFWCVNGPGSDPLPGYRGLGGRVLADPDDAMFLVPVMLWCTGAETVVALAGVLAPAGALWTVRTRLLARDRRGKAASRPPSSAAESPRANRSLVKQQ